MSHIHIQLFGKKKNVQMQTPSLIVKHLAKGTKYYFSLRKTFRCFTGVAPMIEWLSNYCGRLVTGYRLQLGPLVSYLEKSADCRSSTERQSTEPWPLLLGRPCSSRICCQILKFQLSCNYYFCETRQLLTYLPIHFIMLGQSTWNWTVILSRKRFKLSLPRFHPSCN